ncbi:type II toxin-antitoxin system VapC family toxin [Thermodesulfobacteriota bacterium]
MKRIIVLDSYALLAYLNGEKGFEKVRKLLAEAQQTNGRVLMNEINIGETYYILYRKRGYENAAYFLSTVMMGLPIKRVPNNFEEVISASKIKAEYPLSFANCFAIATAHRENAAVMTGDPEFRSVENFVKVEWI